MKPCPKCSSKGHEWGKGWYQFNGDDPMLLTLCEICKQTGKYNDFVFNICKVCNGLGELVTINQVGMMQQQQLIKCGSCNGKGLIELPKKLETNENILW